MRVDRDRLVSCAVEMRDARIVAEQLAHDTASLPLENDPRSNVSAQRRGRVGHGSITELSERTRNDVGALAAQAVEIGQHVRAGAIGALLIQYRSFESFVGGHVAGLLAQSLDA